VWAERRATAAAPAGVVEEADWARVGSGGGVGEEPATTSLVGADPAAASSWATDPAAEAPPELGREGSAAGASAGVIRKGGEGGRGGRLADGTAACLPLAVGGGGGGRRWWLARRRAQRGKDDATCGAEKKRYVFFTAARGDGHRLLPDVWAGGVRRVSLTRKPPLRSRLHC
jgi:hypothetical protein